MTFLSYWSFWKQKLQFYSNNFQIPLNLKDSKDSSHARRRLAAAKGGPQKPHVEGRRGSQGDPTTDSPRDANSR